MHQHRCSPTTRGKALFFLVTLCCLGFFACTPPEPLEIGFIGGLSGRLSPLGIAARNGATLAVEEANANGGIQGRQIKLQIVDDHQDPETARTALRDMHQRGVVAVVGPLTSSMAMAVAPVSNELQLVTIGPTVSTNQLSEEDDYFFRPRPASKVLAQRIAFHMRVDKRFEKLCVIYDTNNRAHSESWYSHLKANFEGYGGQVVNAVTFSSDRQLSYSTLARQMLANPADVFFILAGSIDTAMLAQQLRKLGADQALYASEWSFTRDLLQYGGRATDGLTICHTYNLLDTSPRFVDFKRRFLQRFNSEPSFAAGHSYDAVRMILAALQHNPNPRHLKKSLLDMPTFAGLQTAIKFDRFGDTERKTFLTRIHNGSFQLVE